MRKVLSLVLVMSILAVPAYADFAALERSASSGNIIYDVSSANYLGQDGSPLTESSIAAITTAGYSKTGLTADGNTRLILRYQASSAGTVTFTLSDNMLGTQLESLVDRQPITGAVRLTQVGDVYQASAVLIAPETWPSGMNYPRDSFDVTAMFTPDTGESSQEKLTLTLLAPSVVLIHSIFSSNASTFGYDKPDTRGIWYVLNNAGVGVISWNYDASKGPKTIISNDNNPLAHTLTDAFDALNAQGIASTRADIVAHSMGGLMARQFLRSDIDTGNKSALSYKQGMIRRVVTLAAPNLGSPIASYLRSKFSDLGQMWQNWQARISWENLAPLLAYFAYQKYDASDAMESISLNSSQIAELGYPEIPFHSIYGKVSADNDKIADLIDKVASGDVVGLRKLTWLPQQFIDLLTTSKHSSVISSVAAQASDMLRLKELLTVLFNGEDHDLVVPEKSAVDIFPKSATTAYEGIVKYNHMMITLQEDVGARVLELLKGDTSSFMIASGVNAAEYDKAFDAYVSSIKPSVRASEYDMSGLIDSSLGLSASEPQLEYLGADDDEPRSKTITLSVGSAHVFSEDVIVMIDYDDGRSKAFIVEGGNQQSFDKTLWVDPSDTGILYISYCTVQDGELKFSREEQIVVPPVLYHVSGINFTSKKLYVNAGEEVKLELIAHTPEGNYEIAAPILGIARITAADSNVASVDEWGHVKGLKAGITELTASAEGYTATITVEVLGASRSSTDGETTSQANPGSSGGGCNTGFAALMLLSVIALTMKRR